jgi:hypothetical protein
LARYNGSEPFIYSGEDIRVDAEGQGTIIPHGVYATIVLGYLGIQLLGLDEGAVLLDPYSDPYRVSSIWPERKSDVGWPPWLSYDDSNVRGFVHRLTPQAPIPPGMVDGGGRQIDWSAYGGSEE